MQQSQIQQIANNLDSIQGDILANLYDRWTSESKYENFNDYVNVLKQKTIEAVPEATNIIITRKSLMKLLNKLDCTLKHG